MGLRQWDFPGGGQLAPLVQPAGGGGGTPGSLDWHDDFRSGTLGAEGLVEFANNAVMQVIAVAGATGNWPAGITHVVEHIYTAGMNAAWQALNLWPAPAVGQYLYWRILLNNSQPVGANSGGDHGFQTNATLPIPWFWRVWGTAVQGGSDSQFTLQGATLDTSGVDELDVEAPKDVVLRLEFRGERLASNNALFSFRAYNNETGALLEEKLDKAQAGVTDALWRQALYGMSGQGGATFNGGSVYWTAAAVRVSADADDWIGAYPVGPEI